MVKFYQSWVRRITFYALLTFARTNFYFISQCGHCMRMAADWNRLAEEAPSDVFIKDVNCGEQSDVSSSLFILLLAFNLHTQSFDHFIAPAV